MITTAVYSEEEGEEEEGHPARGVGGRRARVAGQGQCAAARPCSPAETLGVGVRQRYVLSSCHYGPLA
jgi:hypothetical protein